MAADTMPDRLDIRLARTLADYGSARALFQAYAGGLDVDLGYQNFAAELAGLPGAYAPPRGELLLACTRLGAEPLGCIALRPLAIDGCCEMKRLYVAPAGRGHGAGMALVRAAIDNATRLGYSEILLDTLPSMAAAQALYTQAGFKYVAPYYNTPIAGTVFMRRRLTLQDQQSSAYTCRINLFRLDEIDGPADCFSTPTLSTT